MLSSLFVWENFAITSTVRRITSTIRPSSVRMNVKQCESFQQSHPISLPSPSRLRVGYFPKKVSSRNLCFVLCEKKQRYGIESMTTNFAISTLFALYHNF